MPSRVGLVGSMTVGVVVAAGFGVVWGLGVDWARSLAEQRRYAGATDSELVVRHDGTPLIRTSSFTSPFEMTYRTLDGHPVPRGEVRHLLLGAALWGPRFRHPSLRAPLKWSQRVLSFSDGGSPPVLWYLVHNGEKEGAAYFVGYDSKTYARVGYIGPNGFQHGLIPAAEAFRIDGDLAAGPWHALRGGFGMSGVVTIRAAEFATPGRIPNWVVFLLCKGQIVAVDLRERRVQTRVDDSRLVSAATLWQQLPPPSGVGDPVAHQLLAWCTAGRLTVMQLDGRPVRVLDIPPELRDAVSFEWFEVGDGTARASVGSWDGEMVRLVFFWFDESGSVVRREEVAYRKGKPRPDPRRASCATAAIVPAPVYIMAHSFCIVPLSALRRGQAPDYPAAVRKSFAETWPGLLISLIVGGVLALWAHRRSRRYALGRWEATSWTVFVFLGGLPGLVGYLVHRSWPVREACPACSQVVPRDRLACAACGQEFPSPAPRGTEITG